MANQYNKQFKEDAVAYVKEHSDLSVVECARNLGLNENTLHTWLRKDRVGEAFRGQGNFSSDLEKENAKLRRELKDAQDAIKVLKNLADSEHLKRQLFESVKVVEQEELGAQRTCHVSGILRNLGLSRSGYHSHQKRSKETVGQMRKDKMKLLILSIYHESREIYGAPKISSKLRQMGYRIAEKTVGNYMREMGIRACYVTPYTVTTTDPCFDTRLKNYLHERYNPDAPNTIWCSDITYIASSEGFCYLTSIMDLFSHRIIAWRLSDTLEAKWVVQCIEEALEKRKGAKPKIFHSDRGSQYISEACRQALMGIQSSYSQKASPWQNACIESFHALIKREWLNRFEIVSHAQARCLVFEYIETFYNTVRIHSHCGYLSPQEYERVYADKLAELENQVA